MLIEIFGLDPYVISNISKYLHTPLLQLTKIDEKDLFFSAHETILFHRGVDQNAWHTLIRIHLSNTLVQHQEKIANLFKQVLSDHTVHWRIQFIYLNHEHQFKLIQKDYPEFVTEKNQVTIEPDFEDAPAKEIFHGNAFEGKEEVLEKLDKTTPKPTKKKVTN
jgi:hypothetical protein